MLYFPLVDEICFESNAKQCYSWSFEFLTMRNFKNNFHQRQIDEFVLRSSRVFGQTSVPVKASIVSIKMVSSRFVELSNVAKINSGKHVIYDDFLSSNE